MLDYWDDEVIYEQPARSITRGERSSNGVHLGRVSMTTSASRVRGIFVTCIALVSVSPSTFAAESDTIEEIIVTAEKRETAAQETAVSLTAYDAAQLQLRNINEIED